MHAMHVLLRVLSMVVLAFYRCYICQCCVLKRGGGGGNIYSRLLIFLPFIVDIRSGHWHAWHGQIFLISGELWSLLGRVIIQVKIACLTIMYKVSIKRNCELTKERLDAFPEAENHSNFFVWGRGVVERKERAKGFWRSEKKSPPNLLGAGNSSLVA